MNLKPLGDRVILKQDEAEVTTASGLFLASDAKGEAPDRIHHRRGRGQDGQGRQAASYAC